MYKQLLIVPLIINMFLTFTVNAKSGFSLPSELFSELHRTEVPPPLSNIPSDSNNLFELNFEDATATLHAIKKPVKMTLHISPSKKSYQLGELMSIKIISNKSCYLTLVDIGTSGMTNILIPNKYQPTNLLKAGQVFNVPNNKFDLKIVGKKGKEKIWGICTIENRPVFQKNYNFSLHPFIPLGQGHEITDFINLPQLYNNYKEARSSIKILIK